MKKLLLSSLLAVCSFGFVANAQQDMHTYFGVNSLCNHLVQVNPTPSQETAAMHWMYFLAREANHDFTVSGNFMSLIHSASPGYVPFENNWLTDFDSIPEGWDSFNTPFDQSDIDNVVITPYNFSQWTSPNTNYTFIDTTLSPVTAIDAFVSYVTTERPNTPVYIYEGWNDMGMFTNGNFPPSSSEYNTWINSTLFNSSYHDWFVELHDSATAQHPNDCVKMIPVGPIIGELLNTAPYNTMVVDSIFEDDAPHGRPTIYFIAGMITYMALFEEQPPQSYIPPSQFIDPVVIANYNDLSNEIWNLLNGFNYADGTSRVFCSTSVSIEEEEMALQQFKVFPNPAVNSFQIETEMDYDVIVLRNLLGAVVAEARNARTIDVQSLPTGIYLVELQQNDGRRLGVQQVVVTR